MIRPACAARAVALWIAHTHVFDCFDHSRCHLFSTWGPVAIAAIGRLPATWTDRSIEIHTQRRASGELVERMPARRLQLGAEPIRRRLVRWALSVPGDADRRQLNGPRWLANRGPAP